MTVECKQITQTFVVLLREEIRLKQKKTIEIHPTYRQIYFRRKHAHSPCFRDYLVHVRATCIVWGTNIKDRSGVVDHLKVKVNGPRSMYYIIIILYDSEAFWSYFYIWFGFFVLKSLLGITRLWRCENLQFSLIEPRSHVTILIYRTWATVTGAKIREMRSPKLLNVSGLNCKMYCWRSQVLQSLRLLLC